MKTELMRIPMREMFPLALRRVEANSDGEGRKSATSGSALHRCLSPGALARTRLVALDQQLHTCTSPSRPYCLLAHSTESGRGHEEMRTREQHDYSLPFICRFSPA
jgi:hypothetical protein